MDADNAELAEVMQRAHREVLAAVETLERRLGVSPGFLQSLQNDENSWSFLVRLVVFVQAAMAHAVAHSLGRSELESYFARMNLGARQGGLLDLAKKMRLIDSRDVAYVDALSEVRNRFAHKLANIDSSLSVFFASLPQEDFERLVRKLVPGSHPEKFPRNRSTPAMLVVLTGMSSTIWWGAVGLCSKLATSAIDAEWQNAQRVLREAEAKDRGRIGLLGAVERETDDLSAKGAVGK